MLHHCTRLNPDPVAKFSKDFVPTGKEKVVKNLPSFKVTSTRGFYLCLSKPGRHITQPLKPHLLPLPSFSFIDFHSFLIFLDDSPLHLACRLLLWSVWPAVMMYRDVFAMSRSSWRRPDRCLRSSLLVFIVFPSSSRCG